jgi:signal transduction histidine kinase
MLRLEHGRRAGAGNGRVALEGLFGPLFERSRDALLVVEVGSGRVARRNPSAERLFGPPTEEPVWLGAMLPELLDGAAGGPASLLDGRPRATTARCRGGDGRPVEVVTASADGGTGDHLLLLIRPLDELARAEAAVGRLEEALRAVAHDARTPLTGVVGFAELLLERSFPPERQRQLLVCIRREAARLDGVLAQLPRSAR